jgi:hypothetical protein
MRSRADTARLLLAGLLLMALGLWFGGVRVPLGADPYDEGLVANGAALALGGRLPAVDYYAPYPPGAFVTLALAYRVWGTRLLVERWFATTLGALVGCLGFWLIAPPGGQRAAQWGWAAAWLASLTIALLAGERWLTPVNGGALVFVLATGLGLRASLPRGRPWAALLCGALSGGAMLWRLDFGIYALGASLVIWTVYAGAAARPSLSRQQSAAGAASMGLGVVLASGPPLVWILARGGRRAAASLFWWPLAGTAAARLPWIRHWDTFLVPLVALFLFVAAAPHLGRAPLRAAMALWILLVGLGLLSYAMGRTDAVHLLPLLVFSLLLTALSAGDGRPTLAPAEASGCPQPGRYGRPSPGGSHVSALVFLALVGVVAVEPLRLFLEAPALRVAHAAALPGARGDGIYPAPSLARDYAPLLAYLKQEAPPGAPLFCGTYRHDLFLRNDNLLYFLSARAPGTYFWCLDAGVTTTEPVQAEMIRELEAARVEVVVISTAQTHREFNVASRNSDVSLLDDYLRRHYLLAAAWGAHQVYRRLGSRERPKGREPGDSHPGGMF